MIVPAIAFGELLMPVPEEEHASLMRLIEKKFLVMAYDHVAAAHFAPIWQAKNDMQVVEEIKPEFNNVTRSELKADCMIVATAVARRAKCIYSNDGRLHKFAEGFIEARRMSDIARQGRLIE